jgi:hypothetical protein
VPGGWRKLHNEELHNKYNYNDQVKVYEMGGECITNGGEEDWDWLESQKERDH